MARLKRVDRTQDVIDDARLKIKTVHLSCTQCGHAFADHDGGQQCLALGGYCMCSIYLFPVAAQLPARLPWIDGSEITQPGWYWYRLKASEMMRGPWLIRIIDGEAITQDGETGSYGKKAAHMARLWAGPLPTPEGWENPWLQYDK